MVATTETEAKRSEKVLAALLRTLSIRDLISTSQAWLNKKETLAAELKRGWKQRDGFGGRGGGGKCLCQLPNDTQV